MRVTAFESKSKKEIDGLLHVIARVLIQELRVNLSNIFIEYTEAKSGRIIDGGQIVY